MESLEEMKTSVQLAFAKPIKDGHVLLWGSFSMDPGICTAIDASEACESKDLAPQGAIIRELKSKGHQDFPPQGPSPFLGGFRVKFCFFLPQEVSRASFS